VTKSILEDILPTTPIPEHTDKASPTPRSRVFSSEYQVGKSVLSFIPVS